MDLVNSVTQNSNNRNVTMENQGGGDDADDNSYGDGPNSRSIRQQMAGAELDSADSAVIHGIQSSTSASAAAAAVSPPAPAAGATKTQVPDYLKAIGMDPRKFWPKKYRFTREKSPGQHNPLSIAQRNFYETNGYIIIDDCCSMRLLNAIRSQHQQDQQALANEFLLDKLVAKNAKLLQYVKCFCDERVMLMTNRLIETFQTNDLAKAVIDNESAHRQHLIRDWLYLPFRPIDKIVCTITAIEPVEHVVLLVPGTHRVGQCSISSTLESISAAYDTSQDRERAKQQQQQMMARELYECSPEKLSSLVEKSKKGFKYVNLKPGQTLFYHPGLVHGFSNDLVNFKKSQLASIAYYAAADCEYIDLKQSTTDPSLLPSKSFLPISLAHFGDKNPCDYTSWINKPKLLQDVRSNL